MRYYVILILCLCLFGCGGSDHKSIPPEEKYFITYLVQSESKEFKRAWIIYDDMEEGRYYIYADLPFVYHQYCTLGDFLYISADPVVDPNHPDYNDLCVEITYQFGILLNSGCISKPGDKQLTVCYDFHIPNHAVAFDY